MLRTLPTRSNRLVIRQRATINFSPFVNVVCLEITPQYTELMEQITQSCFQCNKFLFRLQFLGFIYCSFFLFRSFAHVSCGKVKIRVVVEVNISTKCFTENNKQCNLSMSLNSFIFIIIFYVIFLYVFRKIPLMQCVD